MSRAKCFAFAPLFSAITLSLLLAGCMVGPDAVRPELSPGDTFLRDETVADLAGSAAALPASSEADFWRRFDDPLLAQLVEDTLRENAIDPQRLALLGEALAQRMGQLQPAQAGLFAEQGIFKANDQRAATVNKYQWLAAKRAVEFVACSVADAIVHGNDFVGLNGHANLNLI